MNRASLWYATLTPRDQRILQAGAVVVVIIILVGVFLPLQRRLGDARKLLATQQQDLAWMRQVAPGLARAGPAPVASATKDSLAVLVDTSARESGLGKNLTHTDQTASGGLRLQLENADFNALAGWLSRLSSQHGVRVDNASITASKSPGTVNTSIQLSVR